MGLGSLKTALMHLTVYLASSGAPFWASWVTMGCRHLAEGERGDENRGRREGGGGEEKKGEGKGGGDERRGEGRKEGMRASIIA